MAKHRRQHRDAQAGTILGVTAGNASPTTFLSNYPASLGFSTAATDVTSIVSAAAPTTYATYVTTETQIFPATDGGTPIRSIITSTVAVTDAASAAALTASRASTTVQTTGPASGTPTDASSSHTSNASAQKSTASKSSALIPAIVVPVVAVLLTFFALFWFFMRRRHRQEVRRAKFVMTGKEKLSSTSTSTRSRSSTKDGGSSPQKTTTTVAARPVSPSRDRDPLSPPPSYSSPTEEIGLARAMTPQEERRQRGQPPLRTDSAHDSRPSPRSGHIAPFAMQGEARNFSSPKLGARPGTAGQQRQPPPNPSFQNRSRSNSSPGDRGVPNSTYAQSPYRPGPAPGARGPGSRGAPSPTSYNQGPSRSGLSPIPGPGPRSGLSLSPASGQAPGPRGFSSNNQKSNISPTNSTRANPPAPLKPIPLGAYNGAGPISQYSPIVKEAPKKAGPKGLALHTAGLEERERSAHSSAASPGGADNFLTEENLRIARLGNGMFVTSNTPSPPTSARVGGTRLSLGHRARMSAISALSDSELPLHNAETRHEQAEDEWEDANSEVSSLHNHDFEGEEEKQGDGGALGKFDFDNWGGDNGKINPTR